jgi:hypothetical protein
MVERVSQPPLLFEVVIYRSDNTDSFHHAAVGRSVAWFAVVTYLISRQDRKHSLVCLSNRSDLASRVGCKTIGCSAGIASGFSDHVGLDGVEPGELVCQSLARVAVQHDSPLQEQNRFLRCGSDLIDASGPNRNLLFDNVTMWRPITSSIFLRLGVDYPNDTELDFRRLNALVGQKLQNRLLVGLGFRVERGEIIASLFVCKLPERQVGFNLAFDETFDGHIPVAEASRLYLRTQHPTANDQPQCKEYSQNGGGAEVLVCVGHWSFG